MSREPLFLIVDLNISCSVHVLELYLWLFIWVQITDILRMPHKLTKMHIRTTSNSVLLIIRSPVIV